LSLALLLKESGRTIDALKQIQALSQQSANAELKAQATVYAGVWEVELGQTARAEEDLKRALQMPEVTRWKDIAQLGLLQLYFTQKKYQQVIDSYDPASRDFGPETRPQLLNLVAMSMRQLGKGDESLAVLQTLSKESPGSVYGKEAAYERLAVLYSTNANGLLGEIDQFLATNPESSKADQVLLMKAETLFKKQDFSAAAPIYAQFENSRTLASALKGEALAKLGWCLMQTKDYDKAIKAYTAFLSGYPTSKSVPSALCQRGLARLRIKDLAGALKDFDELSSRHPKAKERELGLQQKALIQGQMNNNAGMTATFKQLLKDFPETPVAAEANYWIGWVAFESKDYKSVIEPLDKARHLDKEQYLERASLRIVLSYYSLENKEALAREIDAYNKSGIKRPVPYEVIQWLGQGYYDAALKTEDTEARMELYRKASRFLTLLISRDDVKPEDFLNLGRAEVSLSKFLPAREILEKYLASTKEPGPRSEGLLALGQAQIGLKSLDEAQKSAQAVLGHQPDGILNAKARILAGDIQQARGNSEEAARIYESVVVVIDDETVTPVALEKAIEAYKATAREPDAKRLTNTLQSRYPEYFQRKNAHP
ncbi:MAG: Tetratricopeptide 2 repeat protein, partial [Chthoniobacteraceae bacterium]|nr:Tetratricopeptide 2 repeat protein [Chthoniobacteraceae bacterium]